MISNIITDLGGVLFSNGTKSFMEFMQKSYGIKRTELDAVFNGKAGSEYRCGRISKDEFWSYILSIFQINYENWKVLSEKWNECYKIDASVFDVFVKLKNRGYSLFYLSDNIEERVSFLKKTYDCWKIFDGGVFSCEIGYRKPAIEIYQALIRREHLITESCLYIDDNEEFLKSAQLLRMNVLHYEGKKRLETALKKFHIYI